MTKYLKNVWNFQRAGLEGSLEKLSSVGEVWIFFGTTHLPQTFTFICRGTSPSFRFLVEA